MRRAETGEFVQQSGNCKCDNRLNCQGWVGHAGTEGPGALPPLNMCRVAASP